MWYSLNEVTSIKDNASIIFGDTKMHFYMDVYNLCISHPNKTIWLALADVKACFCLLWIHPDLTGAFGFYADEYYCIATAMVFGLTGSHSNEPSNCFLLPLPASPI